MKLAPLLVVLAATPLAHAATADFEGRIALRLQEAAPQGANVAVRGDQLRVDVPSIGGAKDVHAVVDFARGTIAETTPGGEWLPVAAFPAVIAPEHVTVKQTGHWRAVVGQACEDWVLVDGDLRVEACVVPGVRWFDPRRVAGTQVPDWSRVLEARRAFPVSVWAGNPRTRFAMWATDVTRTSLPDEAFAVPRTARVK